MHLSSMVEMVESGFGDRVLLGAGDTGVSGADLGRMVRAGASTLGNRPAVVYADENHPMLPVVLLSAAWAGMSFVPVNYRLEDHQLDGLIGRQPGALVLADPGTASRIAGDGVLTLDDWLGSLPPDPQAVEAAFDDDEVAVTLYTSDTEIVELGLLAGQCLGSHRWMHVLDMFSDDPPVLPYDPAQVTPDRAARRSSSRRQDVH